MLYIGSSLKNSINFSHRKHYNVLMRYGRKRDRGQVGHIYNVSSLLTFTTISIVIIIPVHSAMRCEKLFVSSTTVKPRGFTRKRRCACMEK